MPHDPIAITGNAEFTPENGVVGGSGTRAHPYIIEGWDIDLSGESGDSARAGIDVRLTSAYFVIRRVSIHDGHGYGIRLTLTNNGRVEGVNIANVNYGIRVVSSGRLTLSQNVVTGARQEGIRIEKAWEISLKENLITASGSGLRIAEGVTNLVARGNRMEGNDRNFGWFWDGYAGIPDIDPSNTVNGAPIYFIIREQGLTVPADAGYVAAVRSRDITLVGLTLRNNHQAVVFVETKDSTIEGLDLADHDVGIYLMYGSDGNRISGCRIANSAESAINHVYSGGSTIVDNTFINNRRGLEFYRVEEKEGSLVYHNNFFDSPAWEISSQRRYVLRWDNGTPDGGNFWSDYEGLDRDGDGLGDTPYIRQAAFHRVEDRYPFMEPDGWRDGASAPALLPTPSP